MKPNISNKSKFQPMVMLRALLCFCLLVAGVTSQAATITWGSPTTVTTNNLGLYSSSPFSTSDAYLNGTTKYAYTWGSAGTNVLNELAFAGTSTTNGADPSGNFAVSGFTARTVSGFQNVSAAPSAFLPTAYRSALAGGASETAGAMCTVTLNNLTIGNSYALQVWVQNPLGTSGTTNRTELIANDGGANPSITLTNNVTELPGGLGQYVVGTFTADDISQNFTITGGLIGTGTANTQINAFQLRDLTDSSANTPIFSPVPGILQSIPTNTWTLQGAQNILVSSEVGSTVYYTTDSTTPTTSSSSGVAGSGYAIVGIPANATTTIKAIATAAAKNKTVSDEGDGTFTNSASGTATWTTAGGGAFSNIVNWASSIIPDGPNAIADFSTVSLTANASVTNNASRTIGGLLFDDQNSTKHSWLLTNNTITLVNNLTTPIISNNVPVTIYSGLAGVQGFVKTGSGTLIAQPATSPINGTVYVENGMLQLGTSTTLTGAAISLGTANSGSATTTLRLVTVTSSNGLAASLQNIIISSAAPSSTAVIDGNPNSTSWGNLNTPINLQGGRSVTFTNSGTFWYRTTRNISGNGDVIVATANYANRIILMPTNTATAPIAPNNTWVGNLRITSGAVQITDGLGNVLAAKDAIPDTDDVFMSANTILSFGASETFGALNGAAAAIVGENFATNGTAFNMTLGANNHDGVFNGTIQLSDLANANLNMPLQITKLGTGTQTFNGNCSNTAPTYVGGGALMINSAKFASAVTVSNNATLGGTGILGSNVTVQAGGTLAPGTNLVGTLTINNNLTNGGNLTIKVDKSLSPAQTNDYIAVSGVLINTGAGTLTMTNLNLGQPFAAGDKFKIFSQPLGGGAMNISPASPGPNLVWVNNLAVDGTLSVLELRPTLTSLFISPAGTLNPAFTTNNLGYTATNAYVDNPVMVTATAADPSSTLQLSLNGGAYGPLTSGVASSPQTLVLPSNTLTVLVTSADNATNQTYTLNVNLQPSLAPAQVTTAVSGSTLTFAWPADHLGWVLQMQTNALDGGLKPNGWVTIPGTDLVTQTNISIIKTNPAVFYRITHP